MAVTLSVGGNARINYVGARSIKVKTTADGAQGIIDFTLINPPSIPAVEDAIVLVDGATTLYDGTVRLVKLRQVKTNVFVDVSGQDDADPAGVPTAAAFGLSDTPNGSTTYGWLDFTYQTESTSGNIKSTGVATILQPGLAPGQNFFVTSTNYGLSAQQFTIQQVEVSYFKASAPFYTISFGDPLVRLANVVREIPEGSITTTMISDNAISTPKLQAYAVTTLSNDGATVVIDENGITIEDGYLTFPFPGGENLLLNSGFELGPYVAAQSSHTWTLTADFTGSTVRAVTNITTSNGLALTASTY